MMKQELRLEQRLLLTPQLLLNLKLLALPTIELQALIQRELETNPVLQSIEEETEESTPPKDRFLAPSKTPSLGSEERFQPENTEDYTIADFLPDDTPHLPSDSSQIEFDPIETISSASVSLADIVLPQIRNELEEAEFPIAEYIVENLDEDGFLIIDKEEILNAFKVEETKLNRLLEIIQNIEPGGIATKNTQEALLVQIDMLGYDKNS